MLFCEVSVISTVVHLNSIFNPAFLGQLCFLGGMLNVSCPVQTNEFLGCYQLITLPFSFCVVSWIIFIFLTYCCILLNLL